jgi:hypothetical protein
VTTPIADSPWTWGAKPKQQQTCPDNSHRFNMNTMRCKHCDIPMGDYIQAQNELHEIKF